MWTFEKCCVIFLSLFLALSGTHSNVIGVFTIPNNQLTSKQSLTCRNLSSTLAHDGILETFSCATSVTLGLKKAAWWEVRLPSRLKVTGLETVSARHKDYYKFLDNYEVYICNESLEHIKKLSKCHLCSKSPYIMAAYGSTTRIKCKRNIHGKFVSIVKFSNRNPLSKTLAIAEVLISYNNIYDQVLD